MNNFRLDKMNERERVLCFIYFIFSATSDWKFVFYYILNRKIKTWGVVFGSQLLLIIIVRFVISGVFCTNLFLFKIWVKSQRNCMIKYKKNSNPNLHYNQQQHWQIVSHSCINYPPSKRDTLFFDSKNMNITLNTNNKQK